MLCASPPAGVACDQHAECVEYEVDNPVCVCNAGYIGDGVTCEATPEDVREFRVTRMEIPQSIRARRIRVFSNPTADCFSNILIFSLASRHVAPKTTDQ